MYSPVCTTGDAPTRADSSATRASGAGRDGTVPVPTTTWSARCVLVPAAEAASTTNSSA